MHARIELYCHRFARGKAKVQVMVMGPWANRKAECSFRGAATLLDSKMEVAGNKGRRWEYVRVGCEDAPYLDQRHWSPAGAGQNLKAHKSRYRGGK